MYVYTYMCICTRGHIYIYIEYRSIFLLTYIHTHIHTHMLYTCVYMSAYIYIYAAKYSLHIVQYIVCRTKDIMYAACNI